MTFPSGKYRLSELRRMSDEQLVNIHYDENEDKATRDSAEAIRLERLGHKKEHKLSETEVQDEQREEPSVGDAVGNGGE